MSNLSLAPFARSWPPHSQTATNPRQIARLKVTKMETSQQKPVADVREAQARTPSFTIEIEETVFQKLTNLATKEQIPISQLASEILKAFLTAHHRELKTLIETLKKRSRRE